jgi:NADPH-dependent ferric siderophore reductase
LLGDEAWPEGEGYVWIAGESGAARAIRTYVVETLGHPREWTKAAGYWTLGVADAHERIDD